jgi:hypothetical protein
MIVIIMIVIVIVIVIMIYNYDCYNKEESDSRLETYLSSVITNLNLTNKLDF